LKITNLIEADLDSVSQMVCKKEERRGVLYIPLLAESVREGRELGYQISASQAAHMRSSARLSANEVPGNRLLATFVSRTVLGSSEPSSKDPEGYSSF
jgi:hypothetical protein